MAWPQTRLRTYSSSSEVSSSDLNAIQDAIIGGKQGSITTSIPGAAGVGIGADVNAYDGDKWSASGPNAAVYFPLVLPVGAVITEIKVNGNGDATKKFDAQLISHDYDDNGANAETTLVESALSDTDQELTIGSAQGLPITVDALQYFMVACNLDTGVWVWSVRVTWHLP